MTMEKPTIDQVIAAIQEKFGKPFYRRILNTTSRC